MGTVNPESVLPAMQTQRRPGEDVVVRQLQQRPPYVLPQTQVGERSTRELVLCQVQASREGQPSQEEPSDLHGRER